MGRAATPPSVRSHRVRAAVCLNQDVREIIAQYLCGTVKDACSLRHVSKEWRRAVDTTVRRLVGADQPGLDPSKAADEAASPEGRAQLVLPGSRD